MKKHGRCDLHMLPVRFSCNRRHVVIWLENYLRGHTPGDQNTNEGVSEHSDKHIAAVYGIGLTQAFLDHYQRGYNIKR